ncbi:MlaD family protein [Donghicola mangrovi]|uniref:MCE family protein n=1 Tax=Donghicola mangrovi TaxID=2729614 RepID=A0A850Q3H1_9RHOB|nr:MCE family protein [Donghicola mangrovi]
MSEPDTPAVTVEPARQSLVERASIVWLVPLGALAIALAIAWNHWNSRGPLIEITFANASGVRAGETELKFRDVTVGLVEKVGLEGDMKNVRVSVRLDKDVAPYVDNDALFWVVRPEVTTRGVTGLDTVLSGVFIEGEWDNTIGDEQDHFTGQDAAPLLASGQEGLRLTMRAVGEDSIEANSPILYHGIEVGEMGDARISEDGQTVLADAVIFAPYDKLITSTTRFWNTSGFSLSFGPDGASVDFETISSLIAGGITFDTAASGGVRAKDGDRYDLFDDEETARASLFAREAGPEIELTLVFDNNVSGLRPDAPVELSGLRVGRITNLTGLVDPERFGDNRVRLLATMALQPERLGLAEDGMDPLEFLSESVKEGMRARLTNASILTGGLKVDLVTMPEAPEAVLDQTAQPYPVFPTAPPELTDVAATAEDMFNRVNNLPIEELLQSAIDFLNGATALVANEDTQSTPKDIRALLGDIRGLVGSEQVQAVPEQLNTLLTQLGGVATELNATLTQINEAQMVVTLSDTLKSLQGTVDKANASIDGVPELLERVNAVVAKLETVPVDQLSGDLSALMQSVDRLIDTPQARQLPADLSATLQEVALVLKDLREGGTVANVNTTLQSASDAANAVARATDDLPALVDRLNKLLGQAQATLSGYDGNSQLNRDARTALRALTEAARAIDGLASTLERKPNSLILGR